MTPKRIFISMGLLVFLGIATVALVIISFSTSLPQMIKLEDYKPLLVSEVYARGGEKIGEFYRENRILVPYEKIPQRLVQAFVSAEDDTFFEHGGINYIAIMRAFLVNLTSGEKRQGASTITQQVARSLLLSSEKTYTRKIKEILLAYKMEENLSKEDILFLYLNQIYFGEGAYGIGAAAEVYFRKSVDQLTLGEMAILAGLPQAPSSYSPSNHPQKAKARQRYVLNRMARVGYITEDEMQTAINEPITVYLGKEYKQVAPFFVETIRQLLVKELGERAVLDEGLKIYTSLDYHAQLAAGDQVQDGLRDLDKRQGYRGPLKNLATLEERQQFLLAERKQLLADKAPVRVILPDGTPQPDRPLTIYHQMDANGKITSNIPDYIQKNQIVDAVVLQVDDRLGLTSVQFAEGIGLIDIAEMAWARIPDPTTASWQADPVEKPSAVLKPGDVISIKVTDDLFQSQRLIDESDALKKKKGAQPLQLPDFTQFAHVQLEQRPSVEGALISFDQVTNDVIAMVGGFEWIHKKNEFNRTIQAKRQTGSAFKTIVYAAALDHGYTPATPIQDAPVVFTSNEDEGQEEAKVWKPHNHGQKFVGDILFRNALIRSLNIPTIKILEDIGIPWTIDYAKRLGVFSPLNADLSLGLGSSSITLYEMTKVFSNFGRLGKRIRPVVIQKVLDLQNQVIAKDISLDQRFDEIKEIENGFEERRQTYLNDQTQSKLEASENEAQNGDVNQQDSSDPTATASSANPDDPSSTGKVKKIDYKPLLFFDDPEQLVRPQTAYIMTTLLSGVISEEGGTGARGRALGRPAAGKTGSTNGYYDGWFVGYTPQIATGVWVGFDEEKSLGRGEVGGRTALPIWVDYMKAAHTNLPVIDFPVPSEVVYANIDSQTGKLASVSSKSVVRQAFLSGTAPHEMSGNTLNEDEAEFLKKDLSD